MPTGFIKCWLRCTRYPAGTFAYDSQRGLHPPRSPTNTGSTPDRKEKKDENDKKDDDDDLDNKP